ncbi:IS110 family transposase [Acinetobacter baumannii]
MQYLGIDISKNKFDCCIFLNNQKKKTKVFDNNQSGFIKLNEWLQKLEIEILELVAVMEATSIYHENLAYFLYSNNIKVCVANPARVRKFAAGISVLTKTDEVDAEVLVKYGELAPYNIWQPDSDQLRLLKQLLLRRDAYTSELNRERNRLDQAYSNNTNSKLIEIIQLDIENINNRIQYLDKLIDETIDDDISLKQDLCLLESIPAIGKRTALTLLTLFKGKSFTNAGQAAAFCGLIPLQRQSGSSIRGVSKISRSGSSKIRSKLYMAAVVAIRHNPHIKIVYDRLLRNGKAKMAALCAAMRKLIHIAFGVLKHQKPYNENLIGFAKIPC